MKKILYLLLVLLLFSPINNVFAEFDCDPSLVVRTNEKPYHLIKDQLDDWIYKFKYKGEPKLINNNYERRALYFSGYTMSIEKGERLMKRWKETGGTAVVVDIKDVDGIFSYNIDVPLAHKVGAIRKKRLGELREFVDKVHAHDLKFIARLSMFKDSLMAKKNVKWTLKSVFSGDPWVNNKGLNWLDASNREVQNYYFDVMRDIASRGVDEIQLDYIRFPTEGNTDAIAGDYDRKLHEKYEVIVEFLKKAKRVTREFNIPLSVDVFGVVAWNNGYDARSTGQKIECLAPYVDYIYPMIYPSHFSPGFSKIKDPPNMPYTMLRRTLDLFYPLVAGTDAQIVPWLQAFPYRTRNWGTWYIKDQVLASVELGQNEYLFWSPGNKYETVFKALTEDN